MAGSPQLKIVAHEAEQAQADCSDALLLDAWTSHGDAEAFAALVERYSRLVMGVCRRQCRSREDAEDAFQATFLIMSRDAHKVRRAKRLAGWIHQVAYRTACRARARNQTMTEVLVEEPVDRSESLEQIAQRHRLRNLDEELDRLSEQYRIAIVLHYYEGYTYDQVAQQLNSTEPAIRGRLQRGKEKLQRRLLRRGVSLSVAFVAMEVATSSEAVSAELIRQTINTVTVAANTGGGTISSGIEPLLSTESTIMLSPSMLGILGASMLAFTGLLAAQLTAPVADGDSISPIKIAIPDEAGQSTDSRVRPAPAENQVVAHDDPFGDGESDPFGGGDGDPFSGGENDPFGEAPAKRANTNSPSARSGFQYIPMGSAPGTSQQRSRANAMSPWTMANPDAAQEIEAKLNVRARLLLIDEPLENVMENLKEEYGLPIIIDIRAFDDLGLTTDTPVTVETPEISLESALELILQQLDLVYTIRHETMIITTAEADASDENTLIRVYWSGEFGLQADENSAKMLQDLIDPDSWDSLGGSGTITVLESPSRAVSGFAVRTTYRTHRKIERFLESVRSGAEGPLTGIATQSQSSKLEKNSAGAGNASEFER